MSKPFSKQFRLSITKALGDQLAEELATLTPAPLTRENLEKLDRQVANEGLPSKAGVYQLYRKTPGDPDLELVYVGKADQSLASRLGNHHTKISGRNRISIDEISFTCLYVAEDFSAVAPENLLIKKYRQDGSVPWNTNGFGNNDPGRNRDRTVLSKNHFDVLYPIDLDREVRDLPSGKRTLASLLKQAKEVLPYNFRYKLAPEHQKISVVVPPARMTADDVFSLIARNVSDEWQVVALMGYVIMYPDGRTHYDSAFRYYRGGDIVPADPSFKDNSDEY